MLNTQLSSPR